MLPATTSEANSWLLRSSDDATVKLVPRGLLISWATPATNLPRAASFSASINEFWVSRKFCSAASAASFARRTSRSLRLRSLISIWVPIQP